MCVGPNKAFDLTDACKNDPIKLEQFKSIFKEVLKNYTGFQRIMSIVLANILLNPEGTKKLF